MFLATLQRSAVSFRRQGSSGLVWDGKYVLGEVGTLQFWEMRPSQSTRERGSSAPAGLNSYPRSLSTPANKKQFSLQVLRMLSSDEKKQVEAAGPESKSGKHKP